MASLKVKVAQRGLIAIPKALRETYNIRPGDVLTLIDLGGVFVLSPRPSEVDALADKIGAQLEKKGETLESMIQTVREERAKYGR